MRKSVECTHLYFAHPALAQVVGATAYLISSKTDGIVNTNLWYDIKIGEY